MTTQDSIGTLDKPGAHRGFEGPRPLQTILLAAKGLAQDTAGFRFDYAVKTVPEAGPRASLHYYVFSDRLFFSAMELDEDGTPRQHARLLGIIYNPAYVAWYGLMKLEQSLRQGLPNSAAFEIQVSWLIEHAFRRKDGAVVWHFPVDHVEGRCEFKAPWISVMLQGLAISVLVRAHRIGLRPDVDLLSLCRAATKVYSQTIEQGGVRTLEDGHVLYEEYPGYPLARVLDGYIFGLLGLYDLWIETGDADVKRLFDEGVDGLAHSIDDWNYRDQWSWYGSHGYLCPPHYHNLNRMLLTVVGTIAGNKALKAQADAWNPDRLTPFLRVKIFLLYVWLKQWSRLRALFLRIRS